MLAATAWRACQSNGKRRGAHLVPAINILARLELRFHSLDVPVLSSVDKPQAVCVLASQKAAHRARSPVQRLEAACNRARASAPPCTGLHRPEHRGLLRLISASNSTQPPDAGAAQRQARHRTPQRVSFRRVCCPSSRGAAGRQRPEPADQGAAAAGLGRAAGRLPGRVTFQAARKMLQTRRAAQPRPLFEACRLQNTRNDALSAATEELQLWPAGGLRCCQAVVRAFAGGTRALTHCCIVAALRPELCEPLLRGPAAARRARWNR